MELNKYFDLRHLIYRLPSSWQLPIKDVRDLFLLQPDSSIRIQRLRPREQGFWEETSSKNSRLANRKRILINTLQNFPPTLELDYFLAIALRLRGHAIQGILCDGMLPVCEMNIGICERPPCDVCSRWAGRYERAFGLNFPRSTDYLSNDDLAEAIRLVTQATADDLQKLEMGGVRVGRLARSEIQRYYRGYVFDLVGKTLDTYREWIIAGILFTRLFERLLDDVRPDIVITISGRTLNSACLRELARQRGIHIVTWDTSPYRPNGLKFSHNSPAVEVNLDDIWSEVSTQSLSNIQLDELSDYMQRWSRSEITPYPYNPKPVEDDQIIRQQLGLQSSSPIVVAFTNTSWDMSSVDRDIGFDSMYDWIFSLVQYAISHPGVNFVLRAHPAEKIPYKMRSSTLVVTEVRKRFEYLPSNIKLIEGDDPISSYALGDMAQVIMLYSGMLGLEMALRGKRPWIAGDFTYRGKGFTLDLLSREHMYSLLDGNVFDNQLSIDEVKLAQRFAYLWIFRYVFPNPFVKPGNKHYFLDSFHSLAPGGNSTIEDLCEAIISGKPFIDIGHKKPDR
jgi:hypothetical protein